MMPVYRLHYFPESGNSYKLALMLTLCGQMFEPVWTDFGAGVTWTAEWRRTVNPMGEIPVLEEDGVSLTQTAPILLRLAERYGQFGGADETERFEILRWLFWDNQKLSSFMASYRYQRTFTPKPDLVVLTFQRRRVDDFLGILEARVKDRVFCHRRAAHGRRSLPVRLPRLAEGRDRLRPRRQPSRHLRLAAAPRRLARLDRTL